VRAYERGAMPSAFDTPARRYTRRPHGCTHRAIMEGIHQERVGILGGCFDPIHIGHLIVAECVADLLRLGTVLFIPCNLPPHKRRTDLTPGGHRLRMVERAIEGNPRFAASDIELRRGGLSYTVDTLRELRKRYGSAAALFFIIGADSLREITSWRDYTTILSSCTIVTALRPGYDLSGWPEDPAQFARGQAGKVRSHIVRTPRIEVSSTDIRRRCRRGESIRYMVPKSVEQYIRRHRLYAR